MGPRGGWVVAESSMFAFSAGPFAARHETKGFKEKWPSVGASPLANAGKGWRKYTEDRNHDHVFLSEFSTTLEFSIVDELQSKKGRRLHPLHPRSKVLAGKRFTLEEERASAKRMAAEPLYETDQREGSGSLFQIRPTATKLARSGECKGHQRIATWEADLRIVASAVARTAKWSVIRQDLAELKIAQRARLVSRPTT